MKRPRILFLSAGAVLLCALVGWLIVSHNRQPAGGIPYSIVAAAEVHREQRVELKKAELDRAGVTGDEREKYLQAEKQAAATEFTHTVEAKSGNTVHITIIAKPKDMP